MTLGVADGENVEIKAGLVYDEWLVVSPNKALESLRSGDRVHGLKKERPKADKPTGIAAASSTTTAEPERSRQ